MTMQFNSQMMVNAVIAFAAALILHVGAILAILYVPTQQSTRLPQVTPPLFLTLPTLEKSPQSVDKHQMNAESIPAKRNVEQPIKPPSLAAHVKKTVDRVVPQKSPHSSRYKPTNVRAQPTTAASLTSTSMLTAEKTSTATQPVQDSGNAVQGLQLLKQVKPIYPAKASALGIEGRVKVVFDVNDDGRIANIVFLQATPPNVFEHDTKVALRKWRYATGHAQKKLELTIYFNLQKGSIIQ